MQLLTLGLNHTTAPLAVRERVAFLADEVGAPVNGEAVQQPGADGRSTNALEVRVTAKDISYVVNGTVVHTTPKSGMTANT